MERNRPEHDAFEANVLEANGGQAGGQFFGAEEGFGGIGQLGVGIALAGEQCPQRRDDDVHVNPDER